MPPHIKTERQLREFAGVPGVMRGYRSANQGLEEDIVLWLSPEEEVLYEAEK